MTTARKSRLRLPWGAPGRRTLGPPGLSAGAAGGEAARPRGCSRVPGFRRALAALLCGQDFKVCSGCRFSTLAAHLSHWETFKIRRPGSPLLRAS